MSAIDRASRPAPGPVSVLRVPEIRRSTLDNGLRLWIAPRAGLPEVALRLVVDAGAGVTSPDRSGVASLTGQLLTEGAGGRSAPEMARWLDEFGAAFSVSVGYDVAIVSLHALSDVIDDALDYLAAAALEPSFEPGEVERVRQERLDEIARRRDDAANLANEVLIDGLFGAHPYGRPPSGTLAGVSSLDSDGIRSFYDGRYAPRAATLIAVGDVDPAAFERRVRDRFAGWRGEPAASALAAPPATAEAAGRVILVDRPGARQAEIRIGAIGLERGAEDEFDVMVANAVLGGLFNSRINMNLREDKGWTYGARTSFALRRAPGPFVARAAVEVGVTRPAFDEILSEIDRMLVDPPSDAELRLARNALTLSLPRRFETASQVAGKMAQDATYGLPDDYWTSYRDRIEAVSASDVRRVIEQYLDRERLLLVAATDAERVGADLGSLGPLETVT